jgi:hypothetical protein
MKWRKMMNMIKKILLLCVALFSIGILVPGVLASTTGTAQVLGNPLPTLALTVTGTHSFGAMVVGDNVNTTANSVMATVVSNAPWAVGVSDGLTGGKPGVSVGKMAEWDTANPGWINAGKYLTNAFQVSNDGSSWIGLTGSSQTLFTGSVAGTVNNYPYFKQTIVNEDQSLPGTHTYRMVVTFTAVAT